MGIYPTICDRMTKKPLAFTQFVGYNELILRQFGEAVPSCGHMKVYFIRFIR